MFEKVQIHSRLKSSKLFIKISKPITEMTTVTRLKKNGRNHLPTTTRLQYGDT